MIIEALSYKQCVEYVYERWMQNPFAIISIQEGDSPVIKFVETGYCKKVLHLCFSDITKEDETSSEMFTEEQAEQILRLVEELEALDINELLVHCHAGASRSVAVVKVLREYINGVTPGDYTGNAHVRNVLKRVFESKYTNNKTGNIDRNNIDFDSLI